MDINYIIDNIKRNNNNDKLSRFLSERKINNNNDLFYVDNLFILDKMYNGLMFVSPRRDVILNRDTNGKWTVVYHRECAVHIYNIDRIKENDIVIVTESVIDAKSIGKLGIKNVVPIALYKASFSKSQFHFLMYKVMKYKCTLVLAFDNDTAGVINNKRFKKEAKRKYGIEVYDLGFPYKDINEFSIKSNRFRTYIETQIRQIISGNKK